MSVRLGLYYTITGSYTKQKRLHYIGDTDNKKKYIVFAI